MSENLEVGLRDLFVAVVTAMATILGSYFVFAGSAKQSDVDMVETLATQYKELQKTLFEQQSELISLRIELSRRYEASNVLKGYLDPMPNPAWIKVVRDADSATPTFVLWHINSAYEGFFGVTKALYVGRTDFDIWPNDIALAFYENDLKSLLKMGSHCIREEFPQSPNSKKLLGGYVCKWVTEVDGQLAVAGQLLMDSFLDDEA